MKKVFAVALAMTVAVGMLAGCGSNDSAQGGAADGTITVVSREDGSGTRGAFIELFGIEEKNDAGEKIDHRHSGNHKQHSRYDDNRSRQ